MSLKRLIPTWKSSYRAKIMISVAAALTAFLMIGFVELYLCTKWILLEKAQEFIEEEIRFTITNLNNTVDEIEDISLNILVNDEIQSALNKAASQNLDPRTALNINLTLRDALERYALLQTEIDAISITTTESTRYYYNKYITSLLPTGEQAASVAEEIYGRSGSPYWFPADSSYTTATCGRVIRDLVTFEPLGIVAIHMSEEYLRSLYQELCKTEDGQAYLLCDGDIILSSYNGLDRGEQVGQQFLPLLQSEKESYVTQENGNTLYVSQTFSNDWRLAVEIPESYYTAGIVEMTQIFILSGVCITFFALFVVSHMTRRLTQPVSTLAKVMQDFGQGDLYAQCPITSEDEIGQLSKSFNRMVMDIHRLYEASYQQKLLQQETELRALQMQINPHFLYNTLDTINWKARLSGIDEVGDMAYCLGYLLRESLAAGHMTTMQKEMDALAYYLKIQHYRYGDKLQVILDVDPSFGSLSLPKLIIQPIVENAIVHGIEEKMEDGTIYIWAEAIGNDFYIHIEDDGVGMSEEAISRLLDSSNVIQRSAHIGVSNVHQRIRMQFGQEYGVQITSILGSGTNVTLHLPCQITEAKEECENKQIAAQ